MDNIFFYQLFLLYFKLLFRFSQRNYSGEQQIFSDIQFADNYSINLYIYLDLKFIQYFDRNANKIVLNKV
jgi:hypothetical protein